jgi:hypothetical protein
MENAYRYADKDIRGAADDSKYRVLYISKYVHTVYIGYRYFAMLRFKTGWIREYIAHICADIHKNIPLGA